MTLSKLFDKKNDCKDFSCLYIQHCGKNSIYIKGNDFVNGLCALMSKELSDVLLDDPLLKVQPIGGLTLMPTMKKWQQEKIAKIEMRYLEHFIEYEQCKRVKGIQNDRSKRSSITAVRNTINGIPISFYEDVISQFGLSDIIFVIDKHEVLEDDTTDQNQGTKVAILSLTKILLTKGISVGYIPVDDSYNKMVNTSMVGGLTTKSAFFVLSDTISTQQTITNLAESGYMSIGVMWFAFFSYKNHNIDLQMATNGNIDTFYDEDYLPNAKIGIDSTFYVYQEKSPKEENSHVYVYEVYRRMVEMMSQDEGHNKSQPPSVSSLIIKYWGIWQGGFGIKSTNTDIWDRRADLTGITLRCATADSPPYQVMTPLHGEKEGQVKINGYMADIWNDLQRITNFSYVMYPSIDGSWGSLQDGGNWSGQIGMILRNEVDFAIADFIPTSDRLAVVEFSISLSRARISMYIESPSQGAGWATFINPLSNWTWVITFITICVSSCCISITYYVSKHYSHFDIEHPHDFELTFSFFMSIASMFQQGTEREPKRFSTRIATIAILFASLVVFAAYSASLTSFLAIFKVTLPFTDLPTMYHGTNFKIGSVKNTVFDTMFKTGSEFDKKLFNERYEFVSNIKEGIQKSLDENYGFIWDTYGLAALVGQKCTHVAIPKAVMTSVGVFLMKKKSPCKNMFNYFLLKLQESGQLSRTWSRWTVTPRKDCFDTGAGGLGIFNMLTVFLVIMAAMVLSLIVLVAERHFKASKECKREEQSVDLNTNPSAVSNNEHEDQ